MALTVQEFWQSIVASGLHDEESCRRLADRFAGARESGQIARGVSLPEWMLAQQAMTRYQAKVLLAGTPGPFVYGDYLVTDRLEGAGQAGVFRAIHRPTDVHVCLMFLSGAMLAEPGAVALLAEQTAIVAAASRPTPHLTHCHMLVDLGTYKFFVIDDLPPATLAERLVGGAPMRPTEAMNVIHQVAQGLARLHEARLVHGAIRPDRIWMSETGAARLTAFPLARDPLAVVGLHVALEDLPAAADYLSPENLAGAPPSAEGDVYSLGCTLYRMLAGRVPFPGMENRQRLGLGHIETFPPLEETHPAVPKPVAALVARMLAGKPEDRFRDAPQFVATIAPLAKQLGATADGLAVPPERVKLDTWLATEGLLPTHPAAGAAAATPIFMSPSSAEFSTSTAAPGKRGTRPGARGVARIAGVVAAIAVVGCVAGLLLIAGPHRQPRGNVSVAVSSPTGQVEAEGEPAAAEADLAQAPISSDSQLATPNSAPRTLTAGETVVGLEEAMWASPTRGLPLDLKYVAPGADLLIALRPADLLRHPEAEKLLDGRTTGFLGKFVSADLKALLHGPLSDVAQVVVAVLDSPDGNPRWALVATFASPRSEETLLKTWGDPEPREKDGVKFFQKGDRAYYLPEAALPLSIVVIGPAEVIVDEVIPAGGNPPPLGREMEALLAASDADRLLTVLAAPSVLATGGRAWLPGNAARLRGPLEWFFSGNGPDAVADQDAAAGRERDTASSIDLSSHGWPKAVLASAHLTESDLFAELRIYTEPNQNVAAAAREYRERVSRLPKRISEHIRSLALSDYSRDVLFDFPLMVEQCERFTVVGTDRRQVVLRAYLPSVAAHNLALGTHLALLEPPRLSAAATPEAGQALPADAEPLVRRLDRVTSLVYDRVTLEKSLQQLGEDIGARVVILGTDLQTEGITQNQSFGLEERDQPAREILRKIMIRANPDGKLVYVIKPPPGGSEEALYITTRAAARQRGDSLPAEFVEQP